jgi:hypothetical protein
MFAPGQKSGGLMLAIVFWNARRVQCDSAAYQQSLIDFHQSLTDKKINGFRYSATFRISGVPWFEPATEVFEDWYVMKNFAGMDALDQAVVEEPCQAPHMALMQTLSGAVGGAYGLINGVGRMSGMAHAQWFSKPRDVSDEDIETLVQTQNPGARHSFWARGMAMGPMGNVLLSTIPVTLPDNFGAVSVQRDRVWPPA